MMRIIRGPTLIKEMVIAFGKKKLAKAVVQKNNPFIAISNRRKALYGGNPMIFVLVLARNGFKESVLYHSSKISKCTIEVIPSFVGR